MYILGYITSVYYKSTVVLTWKVCFFTSSGNWSLTMITVRGTLYYYNAEFSENSLNLYWAMILKCTNLNKNR